MHATSTPQHKHPYLPSVIFFHIRFSACVSTISLVSEIIINILHTLPRNKRLGTHCCKRHQAKSSGSFNLPGNLPLSLCTNASLLNEQEETAGKIPQFKISPIICLPRGAGEQGEDKRRGKKKLVQF